MPNEDIRTQVPVSGHQVPSGQTVQETPLWHERRRPFFGLPLSFTTYTLYSDRLTIQSGILTRKLEEIRLYRVLDVSLRQTLMQRLFQLGSVRLQTADATAPKVFLHDIRNAASVLRQISDIAEVQRRQNNIGVMEFFDGFR